ncbi:MAG: sigma-70 family RNA polymerase sigma factor [Microthrixaceae bacterium]|nr:sigma-70 family RNA polymerase sigma factor [Microthrixaceae bacterium]MCB1012309.1 sigma-70 family RNA polymerase sigma factor [Microthrixaceae bacterium]MCO5322641.1 sigma-70 family RNA polymerase sigma factor [Microthrixaceae bacterium]
MDIDVPTSESASARFERWVLPEVDVLLRVAQSITRNTHDAEDLVQDTMLRAYRSIDSFDGRYPRAWLLTILRNTEINRHRRRRPSLLTAAQQTLPDPIADGGATAESVVVDLTFESAVEDAFEHLSDDFREVVELVDIGGLSYAEAAEAADIPEGTVMSRLHRARKQVRTRLEKQGYVAGRPR